jgi:hypothetical protein
MDVLSHLRQLYSLDTLDTRFTVSAKTPLKVAAADSGDNARAGDEKSLGALPPGASPSKWRTPEFYVYAVVFVLVVPQMFKAVIDVSQRTYSVDSERCSASSWC